jgi:hypothetical protein
LAASSEKKPLGDKNSEKQPQELLFAAKNMIKSPFAVKSRIYRLNFGDS